MSEENAANTSSYLLIGPIFLFDKCLSFRQCGHVVDRLRHRSIVILFLSLSSTLTMAAGGLFLVCVATDRY